MSWSLATWNVNSIKTRGEQVLAWLQENPVDVLALQELKSLKIDSSFFEAIGYSVYYLGQRAYNGVAILSKEKIISRPVNYLVHAPEQQARFLSVEYANTVVVCVYVPNGSEVGSEKYLYKLEWLDALEAWLSVKIKSGKRLVILGDFNIAPHANDTYDESLWAGKVLASDAERLRYTNLINLGLVDVHMLSKDFAGCYTWWDYRAGAFAKNKGCRIDLILATDDLANDLKDYSIDKSTRSWDRPSDHCPVLAKFNGEL